MQESTTVLQRFLELAAEQAREAASEVRVIDSSAATTHARMRVALGDACMVRQADLRDGLVFDSVGVRALRGVPVALEAAKPRVEGDLWWWDTFDRRIDTAADLTRRLSARRLSLKKWDDGSMRAALQVSWARATWLMQQVEGT